MLSLPGDIRNCMIPHTSLDVKNIRIMKLSVWAYTDVKVVELVGDDLQFTTKWQIFEGHKLYWEEITGPLETSPAVESFKTTANQMTINLKDGRETGNTLTKITVDKRWNLARLRTHIKDVLQLEDEDKFRVCKFSNPQPELAGEENKSLSGFGLYTGMTLVVKPGAPLLPGHFIFKVFVYKAAYRVGVRQLGEALSEEVTAVGESDVTAAPISPTVEEGDVETTSADEAVAPAAKQSTFGTDKVVLLPGVNQFEFLMDLPVHEDSLISDIRELIFERLQSRDLMPATATVKQVRVRLRGGQTCTDILTDSLTLRQSKVAMYPERMLAVQVGGARLI
jgi:hypothetical protein